MIKRFFKYFNNQKRWNEAGHAMFGFIIGIFELWYLWIPFVLFQELYIDKHWNYFKETKEQQLDFWFDLQSKIIPTFLGYFYINHILPTNSIIYSTVILFLIFFLGYKASWFYSKGDKK